MFCLPFNEKCHEDSLKFDLLPRCIDQSWKKSLVVRVYFGVKPAKVIFCFISSYWFGLALKFSLFYVTVSFTGSYSEEEPVFLIEWLIYNLPSHTQCDWLKITIKDTRMFGPSQNLFEKFWRGQGCFLVLSLHYPWRSFISTFSTFVWWIAWIEQYCVASHK